jgi:hypothetical protein
MPAGSADGTRHAATVHSLACTCVLFGVEPWLL